jgi:hypothetical protein
MAALGPARPHRRIRRQSQDPSDEDLMTVIIDLARVSSFEMFRWQTPMDDMPGDCRIGCDFVMRNHVFF